MVEPEREWGLDTREEMEVMDPYARWCNVELISTSWPDSGTFGLQWGRGRARIEGKYGLHFNGLTLVRHFYLVKTTLIIFYF